MRDRVERDVRGGEDPFTIGARDGLMLDKPLGLIHTALYAGVQPGAPSPALRDITSGNNGAYQAKPGWDACTGLGVPDGPALLTAVRGSGPTT